MNAHDDSFSDSIAVLALGALPAGEAALVAGHVRTCSACRAEYDDLRSVANLVGVTAEVPKSDLDDLASARMKARIMGSVRADVASRTRDASLRAASPRAAVWPYYAAAAALVLAVLSAVNAVSLHGRIDDDERRLADLQNASNTQQVAVVDARAQRDELARRLSLIVAPGAKHFAVADGEVIETRGHIVIAFAHLPAAPNGKVYQAWTLARGAKGVAPSLTFQPDAAGNAVVELPESAANLAAVAVSVEPAGGSKAPTSKPTFVRALS